MSIAFKELMGDHMISDIPINCQQQMDILVEKLNRCQMLVSAANGAYVPFNITSGFRNSVDQNRINPSAPRSKHLLGQAADVLDSEGKLKALLVLHPEILVNCGLWCEAAASTPSWCHMQIVPPRSGNRWFLP